MRHTLKRLISSAIFEKKITLSDIQEQFTLTPGSITGKQVSIIHWNSS